MSKAEIKIQEWDKYGNPHGNVKISVSNVKDAEDAKKQAREVYKLADGFDCEINIWLDGKHIMNYRSWE